MAWTAFCVRDALFVFFMGRILAAGDCRARRRELSFGGEQGIQLVGGPGLQALPILDSSGLRVFLHR